MIPISCGPPTNRERHPEFKTFEPEYHGTDGPWEISFYYLFGNSERFLRVGIATGIPFNKDFNGQSTLGANKMQTFIQRDGFRSSLARVFLKTEIIVPGGCARRTIRVVFGANVSRILVQMRRGVKTA